MICGPYGGGYEEACLLRYNAIQSVESQPTFRRNTSPPYSRLKSNVSDYYYYCYYYYYYYYY
jgi:hypothetical protein